MILETDYKHVTSDRKVQARYLFQYQETGRSEEKIHDFE